MPATIPNFMNNTQSPLGAAFANLSRQLAAQPSEADQQKEADQALLGHWKMLGMKGMGEQLQNGFPADAVPAIGTGGPNVSPVVASNPSQAAPSPLGAAMRGLANAPAAPEPQGGNITEGPSAPSPIVAAFGQPEAPAVVPKAKPSIDMGEYTRNALYAGQKPEDAGGYILLGDANTYGARDPRTTNAAVGAGKNYDSTAESFDIKQSNDLHKADQTDATSRSNNAATQATSRANNADNISKDYGLLDKRLAHEDAQDKATSSGLTPSGIDYAADIYRRTGQLPALGMGKAAAAARETIINRAQVLDAQDGRTGADAVAQFADYQGQRAGQRTAGTREAQAGMAVNELSNLIPVAKHAFANVARTGFVPADQLLNAYQNGTNDPDLNQAAVAVNDVVNAHARAINPNGQVTDAGRAQGYQLLNTAKDQTAFNAILDQMAVGAGAALKSPGQTRAQLHSAASAPLAPHGGNPAPSAGGSDIDALVNHYKTKH